MKKGKYTLKDFLTNSNLDQIIIPEIQRDYVWQEDNVLRFLQSILENSKRQIDLSQGITEDFLNNLAPEMKEYVLRGQKETQTRCNIGFIYAYFDPEIQYKYVLIDGQQRMTTLFLILLALSVQQKKQDYFRRTYFNEGILKLDYKVREASHEFLLKFTDYILSKNDIADISNKYWYFSEYRNDITIQSILSNYKTINDFISSNDLPLDYVENHIEFWYFDTNESKQGEELYLYLNGRGETVRPNESIKANLLRKGQFSTEDKHKWGTEWEQWQSLFWKYKKSNNADNGIEEFLKWIKCIELTKSEKEKTTKENLIETVKKIKESKKINIEGLSFNSIKQYYNVLLRIIEWKDDWKEWFEFNSDWLAGKNINAIDYVKILPMLMYMEKYPNCSSLEVRRFARFFFNITRFNTVSDAPYTFVVNAVLLTNQFLEKEYTDITDIIEFSNNYKGILTDGEIAKLSIYRNHKQNEDLRLKIEYAFREVEDYKFCNGKIWLMWDCIDFNSNNWGDFTEKTLSDFTECFDNFKSLFDSPNDLLRRALLTKGNYMVWDGFSTSLWQDRYSFINEDWRWKEQLTSKDKVKYYKLLIKDYGNRKKDDNSLGRDDILNQIIKKFLEAKTEKDWIYYFVKESSLLSYCGEKKICCSSDDIEDIVLLQSTRVSGDNYCNVKDKVKLETIKQT